MEAKYVNMPSESHRTMLSQAVTQRYMEPVVKELVEVKNNEVVELLFGRMTFTCVVFDENVYFECVLFYCTVSRARLNCTNSAAEKRRVVSADGAICSKLFTNRSSTEQEGAVALAESWHSYISAVHY